MSIVYHARRCRTAAFTLIELLVVIAIISILSSMLLGAVISVKQRAAACRCLGHLRFLGMAAEIYAQNFDGYLPHEDAGNTSPPSGCAWYDELPPFLACSDPDAARQCPLNGDETGIHTYKMNSLLESESRPFYRLGSTTAECSTVLLFDGRIDNTGVKYQVKGTWRMASCRHQGETNLVFLDTHAESFFMGCGESGWDYPGPWTWDPFN